MLKKLFFALFSLWAYIAFAQQDHIKFHRITLEQGLSQSSVFCVAQDSSGFMWFGTFDGVNKFDGFNMSVFRNNQLDSTSIPDNLIQDIFVDSNGDLWIATQNKGICRYDKFKQSFVVYNTESVVDNGLSGNEIRDVDEDEQKALWVASDKGIDFANIDNDRLLFSHVEGSEALHINVIHNDLNNKLWIGTENGVLLYDKVKKKLMPLSEVYNTSFDFDISSITAIFEDLDGDIWVGTSDGLFLFNQQTQNITRFDKRADEGKALSNNYIKAINQDASRFVWVGTMDGLNRINKKSHEIGIYKHMPTNPKSLSDNIIECIFRDRSDALWIGTSLGGISKCDRTDEQFKVFRKDPMDDRTLSNNKVRAVYEDKNGDLWVGTVEGGLNRWDTLSQAFVCYKHDENNPASLPHNHIRAIMEDSKGRFWVGTDGGGVAVMDRNSSSFTSYQSGDGTGTLSNNRVWDVFEDNKANIWVCTYGGGLCRFNENDESFTVFDEKKGIEGTISNNKVTTAFQDSDGLLWIGTFGGGLNVFDYEKETFSVYKNNPYDTASLSNNRIYSIVEDNDGVLWIGTKGNLNRFDRQTKTFKSYSERDGLPNNVVMGILDDESGNLWLSTNYGISKFNKQQEKFRNYDVKDGLQSNEFLIGSFFKTPKGDMLMGGVNGLTMFRPSEITDNPHKPKLSITGFKIFNKEVVFDTAVTEKKIIHLTWEDKVISFDYVALSFIFPQKNQFAYKMEPFDKKWNEVDNRRFASYTNLPHGKYTFRVKGSNNDGVWNEEGIALQVVISPPFWKTWWFRITVVLLLILAVFTFIKMRVAKLKHDKRVLEQKVRERTATITEQKDHIEKQNEEIMSSIHYAQRIQNAVLPDEMDFGDVISEQFILYKPRDIVSGDFYWMGEQDGKLIMIGADCTGHGIPGAFMSMLNIAFLNDVVKKENVVMPDEILNRVRKAVIKSLKQTGQKIEQKDGMDAAVITIDPVNNKLYFAGANNPLYVIRDGELIQLKADRMPVAIYIKMQPFTCNEFDLQKGDCLYVFSDGFADQFGGPKGRKFMAKRFKQLLVECNNLPMIEQKEKLDATIEEWMKEEDQIDDILVMGFRV